VTYGEEFLEVADMKPLREYLNFLGGFLKRITSENMHSGKFINLIAWSVHGRVSSRR